MMTNDTEDKNLIERYLKGDEYCFVELVKKYKDKVYNWCYIKLGDVEDAKEVSQRVFVDAPEFIRLFKGKCKFSTYLFSITKNQCRKYIAEEIKDRQMFPESIDNVLKTDDGKTITKEYQSNASTPLEEMLKSEKNEIIDNALLSLSESHREIFTLIDVEEVSYEEASEILGISIGTVRSRIHVARMMLKEKLKGKDIL